MRVGSLMSWFGLACLAPVAVSAALPPDDVLVGLWSQSVSLGHAVRGPLQVVRRRTAWHAAIGSHDVVARVAGDSLQFTLPGSGEEFRGAWRGRHGGLAGFWIQPAGDSAGYGQCFATPLTLRGSDGAGWSGTVRPLEETFTLYARIWRDDAGLVAAFRNPEFNSRGGAPQFRVLRDGDSVHFEARPDSTRPSIRIAGTLNADGRIRLFWPDLHRIAALQRTPTTGAAAFFPRLPAETTYVYRQPPETDDGWSTDRAAATGIQEDTLARVVRELIAVEPWKRGLFAHSLLIARHGKLVLEEYFYGWNRDRPHDTRSAAKTFTSVLLGAVMLGGTQISPDTPILPLFANRGPIANSDPRKAWITLGQIMTHTSGLACDDNDENSPGAEETMQRQPGQPDWARYTLDLPMVHDPGTRYAYASGGMNLAGAAIATAAHAWIPELFERIVATPLQFGEWHWNLMPNHEGYLGGGAHLRPRDLLKLGQAYLEGGTWKGRRIVSADWVRESTRGRAAVNPATTGLDSTTFAKYYGEGADGYAWHPQSLKVGERTLQEYEANGNGGQILMVIPELDLAVVVTAGNYGQGALYTIRQRIVAQGILPGVR